jgi:hypothetical protein
MERIELAIILDDVAQAEGDDSGVAGKVPDELDSSTITEYLLIVIQLGR